MHGNENEPFWVVWNQAHGLPKQRHSSLSKAETEAKRLAGLNPGEDFVVLASVAVARRAEPVSLTYFNHSDDMPF